jgi:hypothetical protein
MYCAESRRYEVAPDDTISYVKSWVDQTIRCDGYYMRPDWFVLLFISPTGDGQIFSLYQDERDFRLCNMPIDEVHQLPPTYHFIFQFYPPWDCKPRDDRRSMLYLEQPPDITLVRVRDLFPSMGHRWHERMVRLVNWEESVRLFQSTGESDRFTTAIVFVHGIPDIDTRRYEIHETTTLPFVRQLVDFDMRTGGQYMRSDWFRLLFLEPKGTPMFRHIDRDEDVRLDELPIPDFQMQPKYHFVFQYNAPWDFDWDYDA